MPTASIATSAPSRPVRSLITAMGSSRGVVDGDVGAEVPRGLQAGVGQVDGDDVAGAEQPRGGDRGQADRPGAHDGDHVARPDAAGQHADLVAGGQDVGQHQHASSDTPSGIRIGGRVGVGDADVLGLGSVDAVAEHPAALVQALPVASLAAVLAGAAGADARDEDAVARREPVHAVADLVDGARRPRGRGSCPARTSGTSPARMCRSVPQMVVASTRTMASPSSMISGSGTSSHAFWPGP